MKFTDFVGNEISPGDEIVYAVAAYGGGAKMTRTTILNIVPLVPHRDYPNGYGVRGGNARDVFMRDDQANQASPTRFMGQEYEDPEKRYVIQIMREGWRSQAQGGPAPKKYTIPKSQHVMKVVAE